MLKADFHIHSNISDGSDTIIKIVETAKIRGLKAIAITDHDTLSHISQTPKYDDILIVPGLEISAIHKLSKTKVHILGYNIKNPELVTELTTPTLVLRNQNSIRQLSILAAAGFKIDIDKINRADGRYIYKQHIMEYLVTTGQVSEMFGDFYKKTFKNGGMCAFDIDYIDVFEAVKTIKLAGGQAVLAHPGQQKNFWLVPELISYALDGIELNHPSNNLMDINIIRDLAEKNNLFLTGGSDYHGKYEAQSAGIGEFLSQESGVNALCQK